MNSWIRFLAVLTFILTVAAVVFARPNKGPAAVNLDVTIDDSVSVAAGIRSDGSGPYVNGVNGVQASFLSTGVLSFKSGTRQVTALYSTAVEPLTALPLSDTFSNSTILTFVKSGFYLQTMAVGETRCEGLIIGMPFSTDYTRFIGYRAGHGVLTNLAYILVSHPTVDTWVMDSQDGGCSANDNTARINDAKNKGKADEITHGRYFMPFRMTLTRH